MDSDSSPATIVLVQPGRVDIVSSGDAGRRKIFARDGLAWRAMLGEPDPADPLELAAIDAADQLARAPLTRPPASSGQHAPTSGGEQRA